MVIVEYTWASRCVTWRVAYIQTAWGNYSAEPDDASIPTREHLAPISVRGFTLRSMGIQSPPPPTGAVLLGCSCPYSCWTIAELAL